MAKQNERTAASVEWGVQYGDEYMVDAERFAYDPDLAKRMTYKDADDVMVGMRMAGHQDVRVCYLGVSPVGG